MAVGRLGTVEKALRVLAAVSERQPVTVTVLARELGLDKSAVQRAVVTLGDAGWLRRHPRTSAWSLDAQALVVGRRFADGLLDRARPFLEALARCTGETVTLWVVRGGSFVAVDAVESEHQLRIVIPVGLDTPVRTAPEAAAFLDPRTFTHFGDALPKPEVLDAVRRRGYYRVDGQGPGTVALGAPVYRADAGAEGSDGCGDGAVAAVLVTAPASRPGADGLGAHVPALLRTAAAIGDDDGTGAGARLVNRGRPGE